MEEWRDISGYEGLYQVSNTGRVKSLRNNIILKPGVQTNGYQFVILSVSGAKKQKTIHRIVAETFIPNPENKREINHKDGQKTNNQVENLEWATTSENKIHAYAHELMTRKGDEHRRDFLGYVNIYDSNGVLANQTNSADAAAEWLWNNTQLKQNISTLIRWAIKNNRIAYGFKFTRTDKKNKKN